MNKGCGHTHVRTGAASAVAGGVVALFVPALFVPPVVRTSREAGASVAGSTRQAQTGWLKPAGSNRAALWLLASGSSLPPLLGVCKRQGGSGHGGILSFLSSRTCLSSNCSGCDRSGCNLPSPGPHMITDVCSMVS